MNVSRVFSAAVLGLDASLVHVEIDICHGMPKFIIVGLPDMAVQESRERVRAAVKNSDCVFPMTRVTVNLAPADIRKEGSVYDLAIALGILSAQGVISISGDSLFVGELSLEGNLRHVNGVLAVVLLAKERSFKKVFVPAHDAEEASLISGVSIFAARTFLQVVDHLKGVKRMIPFQRKKKMYLHISHPQNDIQYIRGQEQAKRALSICAAGGHNILFCGSPGSGKTMLARAITSILPPLTEPEALEVTKLYSVAGELQKGTSYISERPFRHPHHTSSAVSLVGGGAIPKPGEISLAHRGVLFLDEFPEYPRHVLEVLRQPLEDGRITVARAAMTYTFPAKFILIAAMNPCPCGNWGDERRICTCTEFKRDNYIKKISGPIIDRIDLHIQVPSIGFDKISEPTTIHDTDILRDQVISARVIQLERFNRFKLPYITNSELGPREIEQFCTISESSKRLLRDAVDSLRLSARAYHRILKVARTIADLEAADNIQTQHIAEALQYRER